MKKIEIKSRWNNSVIKTVEVEDGANLRSANLSGADLRSANLRSANLSGASLSGANLSGANLSDANLRSANLSGADLRSVNINHLTGFFAIQCPEEGQFIGWKKASGLIVKLLILEESKRSSATSLKCRCSKAKVIEIQNIDGTVSDKKEISSDYSSDFIYYVGEIAEESNFDDDRFNECSSGIHFFINREVAVQYS